MTLYKFFLKIRDITSTRLFQIRYFKFVTCLGGNVVQKRVRIRPFFSQKEKISIVLGKKVFLHSDILIQGSGKIVIGDKSFIGSFSVIGCNEKITIGKNVMIAQSVSIRDTDHRFDNIEIPMNQQGIETKPIEIKDNVWIGHGAVITKGVTINSGAIVGANAVVTKDVEANSIIGGVPAKLIRYRVL